MVGMNPKQGFLASAQRRPGGFQPYAAGNKVYGGGRPAPNVGMTANKAGYGKRDGAMQARRQAFLDRAKRFG